MTECFVRLLEGFVKTDYVNVFGGRCAALIPPALNTLLQMHETQMTIASIAWLCHWIIVRLMSDATDIIFA